MASLRGRNRRVAAAQERINTAVGQLVDTFGIEATPLPVYRRDPNRQAAEQAEWMADVLEKLAEFGAGGVIDLVNPNEQADEGFDVEEGSAEELNFSNMKRPELNEIAPQFGIDPSEFTKVDELRSALIEATTSENPGSEG